MKVLLIAGHGAGDPGACALGYQEATETRKMANAVAPLLAAYGVDVVKYDQNKNAYDVLVQNTVTNAGISHALIETCFVDDKDDMTLYAAKFDEIAKAIADGVAEGFGLIKEEEDMTEEQVRKIIAEEEQKKTYNTVNELPFGQDTIQKMLDKGLLKGVDDAGNLGLSYDALRIFVVFDRMGMYGE